MEPLTRGHRPGGLLPLADRANGTRVRPLPAAPHRVAPAGLTHLSDEQLFQRYTDGDEHGFQLLMERYEPRIQGFLRKRLSDEERVEDLTQVTFERALKAWDKFDPERAEASREMSTHKDTKHTKQKDCLKAAASVFQMGARGVEGLARGTSALDESSCRPGEIIRRQAEDVVGLNRFHARPLAPARHRIRN